MPVWAIYALISNAAIIWTAERGVEVYLNEQFATAEFATTDAQALYTVHERTGVRLKQPPVGGGNVIWSHEMSDHWNTHLAPVSMPGKHQVESRFSKTIHSAGAMC